MVIIPKWHLCNSTSRDFHNKRLKTAKMVFGQLHIAPWASGSVSLYNQRLDNGNQNLGHGSHLGFFFFKMVKIIKMAFEHLHIALTVKIEIRFALRLTVSKIMAIEVSAVAAILDFSEHLKTAKMAFLATDYCP